MNEKARFGNNFTSILKLGLDQGEIQAEYSYKDQDQEISSSVKQSKAKVS